MENLFEGAVIVLGFVTLAHIIVEGLSTSYHNNDEE